VGKKAQVLGLALESRFQGLVVFVEKSRMMTIWLSVKREVECDMTDRDSGQDLS
jgi:hypothetical protein